MRAHPLLRLLHGSLLVLALGLMAAASSAQDLSPQVVSATRVNTSQPLRTMTAPAGLTRDFPYVVPNRLHKFDQRSAAPDRVGFTDPVLDPGAEGFGASAEVGTVIRSFEGVSNDDNAAVVGGRAVPPDTNGDIGPNHYVQWVNLAAEIFDRDGNSLLGPFPGNAFFSGLGGPCEAQNDGDPIVLYDHLADRWMVMQFQVSVGYALCIAVSATADPTGAYHQYEFPFTYFPDYPKMGVWPDAYYATTRSFNRPPPGFAQEAVAFERDKMLQGLPADMQLVVIPDPLEDIDGFLPADLDGPPPPPGTPGLFAGLPFYAATAAGREEIRLYGFHVDWDTPANSSFVSLGTLPTAPFGFSTTDVPQPTQTLDRLARFAMFRLVYRNFDDHQTLLLNHTVDVGGRAGIRWYELRDSAVPSVGGASWGIYQQGTYAPADSHHRWMASMAMNGAGDIALGYSVSSSTLFPAIRFTGQTAAMSGTGLMDVPETEIIAGGGSQINSATRWGDYSMMAVDPADDETFWFTSEYYAETASFDFKTRIAHIGFEAPPLALAVTPLDGRNGSPVASPVNLPTEGGSVFYRGTGTNSADTALETQVWSSVELPSGTVITENSARTVRIKAGGSRRFQRSLNVASGLPSGTYTVTMYLGTYPNGSIAQASFDIEKADFCVDAVGGCVREPAWSEAEIMAWGADAFVADDDLMAEADRADDAAAADAGALLGSAYPNPFNPVAIVPFTLAQDGDIRLVVYDLLGREVAVLAQGRMAAGSHTAVFDAGLLSSGTYLVRFSAPDGQIQTQRLTLLK